MRFMLLPAVFALLAACSPTTDVVRTSTEQVAGRTWYDIVDAQATGDSLRVKLRVSSLSAARTVAEDVAVKMRAPYDRVEVDVFGPSGSTQGSPAAVLKWSTRNGFSYSAAGEHPRAVS